MPLELNSNNDLLTVSICVWWTLWATGVEGAPQLGPPHSLHTFSPNCHFLPFFPLCRSEEKKVPLPVYCTEVPQSVKYVLGGPTLHSGGILRHFF